MCISFDIDETLIVISRAMPAEAGILPGTLQQKLVGRFVSEPGR